MTSVGAPCASPRLNNRFGWRSCLVDMSGSSQPPGTTKRTARVLASLVRFGPIKEVSVPQRRHASCLVSLPCLSPPDGDALDPDPTASPRSGPSPGRTQEQLPRSGGWLFGATGPVVPRHAVGAPRWSRPRISPQMPPAGASRHEGIRSHLRLDLQQRNGSRRRLRGGGGHRTMPWLLMSLHLPEGASSEPTLDNRCFGARGLRRRLRAELGSTRCR
jgi:hypothetical protein